MTTANGSSTFNRIEADRASHDAEICTVPMLLAVTTPSGETVAMLRSLEVHCTTRSISTWSDPSSRMAESWRRPPIVSLLIAPTMRMSATAGARTSIQNSPLT